MKKLNLILVSAFILGCANLAFGQCTITGNFETGREVNGYVINDHSLSLIKGKKFYVEFNIKNLSNIGGYNTFKIYFPNTGNDLSNPGLTDFRGMILTGILKDFDNVAYSFGSEDYGENDWQKTKERTLDTLSVESKQIRVLASSGTHPRGKYTIKVYSEGCNTNGSPNTGSGNSSSDSGNNTGSKKPKDTGNSNDDGSVDIGKAILDKIKERRNKDKKPKENSGGNNNSEGNNNSNNFGSGVTIFEGKNQSGTSATFGVGTYAANFGPIKAIGNDTASSISVENGYRVKICQHEGNNNQGGGNCEEYGAGSYNLKYDNQASWIKVWKDGNSGNNETKPKVDPPVQDVPYDPNNQISVKIYLLNSKKTGNANCLAGVEEVPMSITKRPSMLRATLEELFRYPEIQRGYLNFASKVSLDDVKLENGTAMIYVSGNVDSGCNGIRFMRQVGLTARQYPTVKAVKIFLNDVEFTG
jgi:hypothetical protein